MSFFSNFSSDHCPGTITGNPLNGLCEKVCIQAEKIFDAGIIQTRLENYSVGLENPVPADPTYPLTFISARSTSSAGTVSNVNVERQADGCNARVQVTITIPIEVVYVDANGVEGKATSSIVLNEDVLMFVPPASIMPFSVTSIASCVSPEGTFNSETGTFAISACVTCILKVSMQVELLVPSYGYCAIPPAQEYSQEVCSGFFELPLYPQGKSCCKK
ncbi:MAG: hypothetical protein K2G44_07405 [Clostridia bacterium]|nr:hypothetical protein [Clostridia bacterium]MDE6676747.1 hypothetical protein [Clostridia bacterium]